MGTAEEILEALCEGSKLVSVFGCRNSCEPFCLSDLKWNRSLKNFWYCYVHFNCLSMRPAWRKERENGFVKFWWNEFKYGFMFGWMVVFFLEDFFCLLPLIASLWVHLLGKLWKRVRRAFMPGWILQVLTNPYFIIALSVISLGVLAGLDSFQLGLYSQTYFHNLQNIVLLDCVCSSFPK